MCCFLRKIFSLLKFKSADKTKRKTAYLVSSESEGYYPILPCSLLHHITRKAPLPLTDSSLFPRQYRLIPSQSAKTYDSQAVKSIFALLLEEVTRPDQAYPEGRNALKK